MHIWYVPGTQDTILLWHHSLLCCGKRHCLLAGIKMPSTGFASTFKALWADRQMQRYYLGSNSVDCVNMAVLVSALDLHVHQDRQLP